MRIIGGKYKGKRILPPKKFPSRPTTDMAKEALFNILQNQIYFEDAKVLDLFAGTGNISLEFLSRGAMEVLSIEKHPLVIKHLNKIQKEWEIEGWSILRKDVFKAIEELDQSFNVIFADPPFQMRETADLPDFILNSNLIKKGGLLIIEHGQENSYSEHQDLTDTRRYGGVYFSFFKQD